MTNRKDAVIEIQEAFNKASEAVRNLEATIRIHENTPLYNINPKKYDLITLPRKYIRTREYFNTTFHLNELVLDWKLRDSICYAFMQSDLHGYILNRFGLYNIVQKLFIKNAIINLVSIIEALMIATLHKLNMFCVDEGVVCRYNSSCTSYIKSTKNLSAKGFLKVYREKIGLMNDSDQIYEKIEKLINIRNKVHLSIIEEHEYATSDYSLENYKMALNVLGYLKNNLLELFTNFKNTRNSNCRIIPVDCSI